VCLIIDFIDGGLVEVEGWDFEAEKVIGKGYISFAATGSAGFKKLKLGRMREVMRWRRDIFVFRKEACPSGEGRWARDEKSGRTTWEGSYAEGGSRRTVRNGELEGREGGGGGFVEKGSSGQGREHE
jgi:hypothetical protein